MKPNKNNLKLKKIFEMAGIKRALLALTPFPPCGLKDQFNGVFSLYIPARIRAYRADCPKRKALERRMEEIRRAFCDLGGVPEFV